MITNEVLITPDGPKLNPKEQYLLYAPIASEDSYGVIKLGQSYDENYYLRHVNGVLNLDIEKAKRHLIGPQGPVGPQGPQGPKGDTGMPFMLEHAFTSVDEMYSDPLNDGVPNGQFVIIDTGNPEDEDNSKIYRKDEIYPYYHYVGDISGKQGIQGPAGPAGPVGPQGPIGPQGQPPLFRIRNGNLQVSYDRATWETVGMALISEADRVSVGNNCEALTYGSIAIGENTIAGSKGFYFDTINREYIKLKPINHITGESRELTAEFEGKEFSIINGTHYGFCGTITRINFPYVYYTPTTSHGTNSSRPNQPWWVYDNSMDKADFENHIFWIPEYPKEGYELRSESGEYVFAACFASGDRLRASADDVFLGGEENIAGGNHCTIFGVNNKGSYGNFIACRDNFSSGLHSVLLGRGLTNHGDYNLLSNRDNEILRGSYNAVFGYNCKIESGSFNILAGDGNKVVDSYNAVFGSNVIQTAAGTCSIGSGYDVEFSGKCQGFAGREHTISGENHGVFGAGNTVSGSGHFVANGLGYRVSSGAYDYAGNSVTGGNNNAVFGTNNIVTNSMWCFTTGFKNNLSSASHVYLLGRELTSKTSYQTVLGRANAEDSGAALVIGDTTTAAKKNCLTVGSSGTRESVDTDAVTVSYFKDHMVNIYQLSFAGDPEGRADYRFRNQYPTGLLIGEIRKSDGTLVHVRDFLRRGSSLSSGPYDLNAGGVILYQDCTAEYGLYFIEF